MVVRMWHWRVQTAKAAAYRDFLNARAIPDCRSVAGNISVHILERQDGDVTHFMTMTFWESLTAGTPVVLGRDLEVMRANLATLQEGQTCS